MKTYNEFIAETELTPEQKKAREEEYKIKLRKRQQRQMGGLNKRSTDPK